MKNIATLLCLTCLVELNVVNGFHVWPSTSSSHVKSTSRSNNAVAIDRKQKQKQNKMLLSNDRVSRIPTQLALSVDYNDETVQIGNGARSSLNCEVDYLGMINFCLRSSDNGLSPPSTFKVMNEITNDVFRVIMMGYEPAVDLKLLGFSSYKDLIIDTVEKSAALAYLSWLEKILINGEKISDFTVDGEVVNSVYVKGYTRLLDLLQDAGCKSQGRWVDKCRDRKIGT